MVRPSCAQPVARAALPSFPTAAEMTEATNIIGAMTVTIFNRAGPSGSPTMA